MAKSNTYLDELFEKAREEEPIASFEEIGLNFSNTIASGYSGASAIIFSKFKLFIIGLSCFIALITIAIVFNPINNPLADDIPETANPLPVKIDVQKKADITLSPKNDQKNSTSNPSTIQKVEEKKRDTSHFTRNSNLLSNSVMVDLPRLKLNAVSMEQLSFPTIKKRPIILPEFKESQGTAIEFTINDRTSTQKLARIAYQAQQAEIDYTYVVDLKKQLIREFNVDMSIPGTDLASTIQISVPKNGAFEITFGWFIDASGKAIQLTDEIAIEEEAPKHPLRITRVRNLCQIHEEKGINYIERHFDRLIKEAKLKGDKENILNTAGYLYIKQHAFAKAIEIFNLNARLFPKEPNPWDSLGEALYKNGDKENALQAFQKALSIDPQFSSSQRWVKKIMTERK